MVEFALAVPVFLLLLFAILELGLFFLTRSSYQEAAQQAARVVAAAGNATDADTQGLNQFKVTLAVGNLSAITAVTIYDATVSGDYASVPGCASVPCPNTYDTYIYSPTVPTSTTVGGFVCASNGALSPDAAHAQCPAAWDSSLRHTDATALDHVGVTVSYRYKTATGLLPTRVYTQTITTLMEPRSYGGP